MMAQCILYWVSDFLTAQCRLWVNSSFGNFSLPKSVSYCLRALHPKSFFFSFPNSHPKWGVYTSCAPVEMWVCLRSLVGWTMPFCRLAALVGWACWSHIHQPLLCLMLVCVVPQFNTGYVVHKASGGPGPSGCLLEKSTDVGTYLPRL